MTMSPQDGKSILVMGEAILDLVATAADPKVFDSATGGSSFNTALALGRLGIATEFAGALAHDVNGEAFAQKLTEAHVGLRWCQRSRQPMPIALARSDAATGAVDFTLYLQGTAHEERDALPDPLPDDIAHLHAASFRCLLGPQGERALAAMHAARERMSVSFDPNIRPSLMPERSETVRLVEARIQACTLAKASDMDIAWLYPDQPLEQVARHWLALGAELVVITGGATGATATWTGGSITCVPPHVTVVDTVGAGDSFTAGLLAALRGENRLGSCRLNPDPDAVGRWLAQANKVAALTCTRRGSEPPWSHEL
ncbi:PfkB family carbohydrate kinase [Methylocella sp. CPCC 101449]|jgi:fructokinase|uniref:PfkB family carbohydrate kinase n=1 Tax=Methylocella sp. CPCC 101449 TaxID=2987531 RepID=UPI002891E162|nr:PfkB family carbohydrate kinase [Methylocella sp. CPCC 101449]MDT2024042.1 PfkB family carbohydrate kinase [Methylocella sp. CPCC 101449]HEV2570635.1 PfkB family carbohydrate kinase [Beijerinckiaceae bacterium]